MRRCGALRIGRAVAALTLLGAVTAAASAEPSRMASPLRAAEARDDGLPIVRLRVDAESMAALRRVERNREVTLADFVLAGPTGTVETVDVDVERFEIFADDATIVDGSLAAAGAAGVALPRPDVALYRGSISDRPGSHVFLGVSSRGVHGYVQHGDRLQIISSGPAAEERELLVYDASALPEGVIHWRDFVCATEPPPGGPVERPGGVAGGTAACREVRFAIETDHEFAQLFGGDTGAASEYIATLFGAVSAVYTAELDVRFSVGFVRLWSLASDPWTASSTADQLFQFIERWTETMAHVDRQLAHFLSGRSLGGGIAASIGGICEISYGAYAVSANLNGFFPYPIQDHHSQNWDPYVVAHEIGHNFGAPHTHQYCPPLDRCASGPCHSQTACQLGTIMSYCHQCPGGISNVALEFHPGNRESILAYLDTLSPVFCPTGTDDCSLTPWNMKALPPSICSGMTCVLSGFAAPGHVIRWYAGECGAEFVGEGDSIEVSPETTTTYFARLYDLARDREDGACAAITVPVMDGGYALAPGLGEPGLAGGEGVSALTSWGGDVVVGGAFTLAGGTTVNRLARWDGESWYAFGAGASVGVGGVVLALTEWDGDLVVGGNLVTAGGQTVNRIARWTGSAWAPFVAPGGTGVNGTVRALAIFQGDLVAGGSFTQAGGEVVNGVSRWDGAAWQPFAGPDGTGVNGAVHALRVWNDQLVAAGSFSEAGGVTVNGIARWDGSAWHPLAGPDGIGVDGTVHALCVWNGQLVAGGAFTQAGGRTVNGVARWDGSQWRTFTSGGQVGVGGGGLPPVSALAVIEGDLIVGGAFASAGGQLMNGVARWDGAAWRSFPVGSAVGIGGAFAYVGAMAAWNGDLVMGGGFTVAGGQPSGRVAHWRRCPGEMGPQCAVADIDCNGLIDGADLAALLGQWGPCPACTADLDEDGIVDGADLAVLLGQWAP